MSANPEYRIFSLVTQLNIEIKLIFNRFELDNIKLLIYDFCHY